MYIPHPFFGKLNEALAEAQFDDWVESPLESNHDSIPCRLALPPGVYSRLLFLGYFEGITSERGMAWRVRDSLSIREYLGYAVHERTPDHSTILGTRRRLPLEFHEEVFSFALAVISKARLVEDEKLGLSPSTVEANVAMRSIVHRGNGRHWMEFMSDLARTSGKKTLTRAALSRIAGKRTRRPHPTTPRAMHESTTKGRTSLHTS